MAITTTLNDLQVQIALDFDSYATAPSITNPEWARRVLLINRYEKEWARMRNFRWTGLFTQQTLSTVVGQAYVNLATDFVLGNEVVDADGMIDIGNLAYKMIDFNNNDLIDHYVYITGNEQAGFKLNIYPTPSAINSFSLPYYSTNLATNAAGTAQTVLALGTDITRCQDPMYIVYMVLADLFKVDDEGNKGLDFERKGAERLNDMMSVETLRGQNFIREIPDWQEDAGGAAIGD
jgi:hypothetical protein